LPGANYPKGSQQRVPTTYPAIQKEIQMSKPIITRDAVISALLYELVSGKKFPIHKDADGRHYLEFDARSLEVNARQTAVLTQGDDKDRLRVTLHQL